jgi:hypothetical protein
LAQTHYDLGRLLTANGDRAGGRAAYDDAIAIQKRLLAQNPSVTEFQIGLGGAMNNIALLDINDRRFAEATETVINHVDQQDRLAEVTADGSFTLKLNGEDHVIVDLAGVGSGQVEKHVLAMYWLWNDGSQDRSGIQLVRFRVQRLGVQVFPALP